MFGISLTAIVPSLLSYRFSIVLLVLGALLFGCLETAEPAPTGGPTPSDVGYEDTATVWPEPDAAGPSCTVDAHADTDQDGLLDVIEDANRNCRIDAGETDPEAADTDGDGLVDGDEDVDRNGAWDQDRGELDPRTADTDQDGVPDGAELIASVCNSTLTVGLDAPLLIADREVYVGRPVSVTEPAEHASWISYESGAVDWLTVDANDADGRVADPATRRVVYSSRHGADRLELTVWPALTPDEFYERATELQLLPARPETIELGPGPYEVSHHVTPDGRGRIGITPAGTDPGVLSARAMAPSAESVVRARCAEVFPEPALASVDLVFVFATDEATLEAAAPVFERLVHALEEREAAGLATRIWLIRGDSHVTSSAGAPIGSRGHREASDVRPALAALEPGDADQRVWMNARAALHSLAMGRLEGTPVLITLSAREDTEYRAGATEGYDGHAFAEPLPAGERRDALDEYYGEFFSSQVGDAQVHLVAGRCETPRTDPLSSLALAERVGGTFGDLCGLTAADAIDASIAFAAGARAVMALDGGALPGSVQAVEPLAEAVVGPGQGVVPVGSTGAAHVGYLYWDAPGAAQQ